MTHHKVPFMYLSEVGADVGLGTAGRFSTTQGILVGSQNRVLGLDCLPRQDLESWLRSKFGTQSGN